MKDLTQGSVTKHLLHMSAFLAASMLVQTLYLLADLYWVGHLGKEAIAAVGVVGNLMMIVLALAQMLGVGTTTLLSHAAGRKDQAHAEAVFNQSFVMSIAIAFGLGIVGFILRPAYCDWLSADAATAELGKSLPALVSPGAVTPVSSCCAGVSAARHRRRLKFIVIHLVKQSHPAVPWQHIILIPCRRELNRVSMVSRNGQRICRFATSSCRTPKWRAKIRSPRSERNDHEKKSKTFAHARTLMQSGAITMGAKDADD